jgi:GT2 family glycosyltransferase
MKDALTKWPDVAVLIPTYNRAQIVRETVELLRLNLRYSGDVHIYVGVDGTDHTSLLLEDMGCFVLPNPAGGIGANLNRLIRAAQSDRAEYFIGMDDDHHLIAPLCLDRHVRKLRDDLSAGWIHLLMEAKGDEHYDRYRFTGTLDGDHYWRIHWDSVEHFIMSFRPHVFHQRWLDSFGYLPERLRTGETEYTYAKHAKQRGQMGVGVNALVPLRAYGAETWHHNNGGNSWNQMGL